MGTPFANPIGVIGLIDQKNIRFAPNLEGIRIRNQGRKDIVTNTSAAAPPTGPMQVLEARPPWRESFASLRVRNYRRFAAGNLVANTAVWMQRIAMDWLVLQLSHSVAAVGVTVFM